MINEEAQHSECHQLGILGNEGREMGIAGAPDFMLAQCSISLRHLQCRWFVGGFLGRDMGIQVGRLSYTMLHYFYGTISFAFFVRLF